MTSTTNYLLVIQKSFKSRKYHLFIDYIYIIYTVNIYINEFQGLVTRTAPTDQIHS